MNDTLGLRNKVRDGTFPNRLSKHEVTKASNRVTVLGPLLKATLLSWAASLLKLWTAHTIGTLMDGSSDGSIPLPDITEAEINKSKADLVLKMLLSIRGE
jgi:hypothetical protein